ncbi:MAG TPA: crotonase/enoyl-CoA hydratase family protein [Pseudomonadales bacterium]|nr:crotonase/enoyl-CoA hydratase family protein [Pseudomonadales bacterium]
MSGKTRLEGDGDCAWISMDDGKVNVMSKDMLDEVASRLDEARDASVTVLSGRNGIFSAGFDLKAFQRGGEASQQMVTAGVRLIEKMLEHPRPIIAACTGHAYPMGAFLMLASDLRIGVAGSWKIGMNEVAIGLTVPHFALALARHRLSPPGFARVTTAAMFAPEQALAAGYLDAVVDDSQLRSTVADAATQFLALNRESYAGTKARINAAVLRAVREGWEMDQRRPVGT